MNREMKNACEKLQMAMKSFEEKSRLKVVEFRLLAEEIDEDSKRSDYLTFEYIDNNYVLNRR